MKTFFDVYKHLRRKNRKQYLLLSGCLFFSVLLISSYVSMMRSQTVLTILPEGGDSRKQVMMIFVLTVIGCMVFSLYAASLFFRQKSQETGILLALGADRRILIRLMVREMCVLSTASCILGIVLSIPLTKGIWILFRLLVVDTEEMALLLDPQAFLFSCAFSLAALFLLLSASARSIRRVHIIDIISESHKSEPIHAVPQKYGFIGIALIFLGIFMGYNIPSYIIEKLNWYLPEGISSIFYLPAFAGLYMVLLHAVVNGWHKKNAYKDLVATSQMKFQGRQTVKNLLVMTVLIAGAFFASFYTPTIGIGSTMEFNARSTDYVYRFRRDQDIPMGTEVQKLAGEYGVEITDWTDIPAIRLGVDGEDQIKKESAVGIMLSYEYKEVASSDLFLPASAYTAFTGEELPLPHGSIAAVSNPEGIPRLSVGVTLLTNTLTGRTLPVDSVLSLENDALSDCYVLNDEDFISMNEGLTDEWREMLCLFNVEDCGGSYDFAKALLYDIIDRSGEEVALFNGWDPVRRQIDIERTGEYFLDSEHLEEYGFSQIRYEERDSTVFRLYWAYMPKFRVLDRMDFVKTLAVFLMLFIFISLVCFAAVFVIAFTRTMTIALTGKGLYEDLRRLGASNAYLYRTVRSQAKRVFVTPAVIGTGIIYLFYVMMLYFNDGRISVQEWAGLSCCGLLTALVFCVYYGIYRITLQKACRVLNIK